MLRRHEGPVACQWLTKQRSLLMSLARPQRCALRAQPRHHAAPLTFPFCLTCCRLVKAELHRARAALEVLVQTRVLRPGCSQQVQQPWAREVHRTRMQGRVVAKAQLAVGKSASAVARRTWRTRTGVSGRACSRLCAAVATTYVAEVCRRVCRRHMCASSHLVCWCLFV